MRRPPAPRLSPARWPRGRPTRRSTSARRAGTPVHERGRENTTHESRGHVGAGGVAMGVDRAGV
eukprot:3498901-Prymnesium_polylepis.2